MVEKQVKFSVMERKPAEADIFFGKNGVSHDNAEPEVEQMARHHELKLVQQSVGGNPDAFGELFGHYRPKTHRYIYNIVGNNADAEDLVSSTFESAFKAIPKYQITEAPFSAWIIKIAHNKSISHLRAHRIHYEIDDETIDRKGSVEPHTQAELSEDIEKIKEALLVVSERSQKALILRHFQDWSYKEIASELGVTVGNARVIVCRGLEELRKNLLSLNTIDINGENVA